MLALGVSLLTAFPLPARRTTHPNPIDRHAVLNIHRDPGCHRDHHALKLRQILKIPMIIVGASKAQWATTRNEYATAHTKSATVDIEPTVEMPKAKIAERPSTAAQPLCPLHNMTDFGASLSVGQPTSGFANGIPAHPTAGLMRKSSQRRRLPRLRTALADSMTLRDCSVRGKMVVETLAPGLVIVRRVLSESEQKFILNETVMLGARELNGFAAAGTPGRDRIYERCADVPAEFSELAIRSAKLASAIDPEMPACTPTHVLINKYTAAAGLQWHRLWPRLEQPRLPPAHPRPCVIACTPHSRACVCRAVQVTSIRTMVTRTCP